MTIHAIDSEEHALDMLRAEGGSMKPRKREKRAVWHDNLCNEKTCEEELIGVGMGAKKGATVFQSDNEEGDQGNRKRGSTNLAKFGAKCAEQLGPRFKIEKWTYKARTPTLLACWHFDLADKAGSALGGPPGTLFEGVFGMEKTKGQRWVTGQSLAVRKMTEQIEAEKTQPNEGAKR